MTFRLLHFSLGILSLGFCSEILAQSKPKVFVELIIKEENYRDQLSRSQIEKYSSDGSKTIAELLNRYVGFVDFSLEQSPDTIYFILNRDSTPGSIHQVDFKIFIKGNNVSVDSSFISPSFFLMFRPKEEWDKALGTNEALQIEIRSILESHLSKQYPQLIDKVLSHLVLTRKVLYLQNHTSFVIPFSYSALGTKIGSQFIVNNKFSLGVGEISEPFYCKANGTYSEIGEFKNGIMLRPKITDDDKQLFSVKWHCLGIQMSKYVPYVAQTSVEEISPSSFNSGN